jgi:hypothetical protein
VARHNRDLQPKQGLHRPKSSWLSDLT